MSTRGWVTVNVFWLVTKGHEDIKLVSPESVQGLQLCPHASSLQKRISVDKVPQPVHNYNDKTGENCVKMFCGIVDTVGRIKKLVQEDYLWTPGFKHLKMRLVRSGSLVPDETPLCDILARTTADWTVDFILESSDPGRLPIRVRRGDIEEDEDLPEEELLENYPIYDSEKGILTVKIDKDLRGDSKILSVEIVTEKVAKPFLGGFRIMPEDIEFHHASIQTEKVRKRTWSQQLEDLVSRGCQTQPQFCKYIQTPKDVSTQTQVPGIHLSTKNDYFITPTTGYRSSVDFRKLQIKAAILIQTIYRGYVARKRHRLETLELLSGDSSADSFEEELQIEADNEAKHKQDFQRLYAKLESWRVHAEKQISNNKSGFALRRARAKLVTDEALKLAELAANRDSFKDEEKKYLIRNIIFKAGQPRLWFSSTGKALHWESPGTTRARELADVYRILDCEDDLEPTDRLPGLEALKNMLKRLDSCPLITELQELISREETLIERGVKAANLYGLRQRLLTRYMQLIRSPAHNPEITRFETQLPVPVLHTAKPKEHKRGANTEFCLSCRNYLPRTKFSLSSGVVGRCSNCEQLDNDARSRQDLSVYKSMLDRIKHDEESRNNTTSPIFQLQDSDIRYIVRSFWDSRSILSGLSNMYELKLIRWVQDEEWSPWNCILLTHTEADIHGQLSNLFKAYGALLVQKIRHKHTLARNHFSKMSTMENYFKSNAQIQVQESDLQDLEEEEENTSSVLDGSGGSQSVSTMT